MNMKQACFRILILFSVLYLILYSNWYFVWRPLTPDHVWYITWGEFLLKNVRDLSLCFLWLMKMFIKAALVSAFGCGILYGLFRVDKFLGRERTD